MTTFTMRATTTDPITFQCQQVDPSTGVASNVDLTGATAVELHLRPAGGGASLTFTLDDQMSILDASSGKVRFTPDPDADLNPGKYEGWLKITLSGTIVSFPSDQEMQLVVIDAY